VSVIWKIYIRGTDNRIYKNYFNRSSGSWGSWNEIGGGGTTISASTAVIAIFGVGPQNSFRTFVFGRGTDNRIYVDWRQ
jgi:hypothetical protein